MTRSTADLPACAELAIARIRTLTDVAAMAAEVFEMEITRYEVPSGGRQIIARLPEHEELAAHLGAYDTLNDDFTAVLRAPGDYRVPVSDDGDPTLGRDQRMTAARADLKRIAAI